MPRTMSGAIKMAVASATASGCMWRQRMATDIGTPGTTADWQSSRRPSACRRSSSRAAVVATAAPDATGSGDVGGAYLLASAGRPAAR